jgi:hypothetical protein
MILLLKPVLGHCSSVLFWDLLLEEEKIEASQLVTAELGEFLFISST